MNLNSREGLLHLAALIASLFGVASAHLQADTPKPRKAAEVDLQMLERILYEEGSKPDFEGEMHFIPGVPLISRTPDTLPESQYLTSLILHGRHVAEGMLHAPLQQQYFRVISERDEYRRLTGRIKSQVAAIVFHRIFGVGGDLTPPIAGIQGSMKDATADHDHDHGDSPHPHGHHQHYSPTPVGYSSSLHEVTTGLHALLKVDARLRKAHEQRVAITGLVGTSAIEWRIYERENLKREHYKRFLSRSVPFVAHRRDGEILVCGYATYKGATFLMAFDLAKIERRVSLGGGGSVTYSEYLKLKQAEAGNPAIGLDPLFWDYTSYFSSRNLDCFLLSPALDVETITALYPIDLDAEAVSAIITEELRKAQIEHRQPGGKSPAEQRRGGERHGQDERKERDK